MNASKNFDTILELRLSGNLAHFRKFYTNASSLSYTIPPRTAICGLVASILMLPRDSYYQTLCSENLGVGIRIPEGTEHRKQFFTMNYVGDEKNINDVSGHKQCRLELLMASKEQKLSWTIYLGIRQGAEPALDSLEARIRAQSLGFDVYLGQRQFRAEIELLRKFSKADFSVLDTSEYVDSVLSKDQIAELDSSSFHINIERMPLEQALETKGKSSYRRSVRFADVVMETSGQRLRGQFSDLIELQNEEKTRISFL
ncbi:MAG: CRISPR-associated protein Cas5 [Candidatus Cloacimonetes bacterium]|jgi:CRISPR-associated protein Cas5h|nr:CRISPR-associated protein Cas5 [Candidatus Cloacimonadota bacterium]MDY0337608.1 CRISPR-associated protein Cas5 [Candidatus Cloacimonadaceae bacterium]MCK9334110.1 CRISPR-associated protein Cas5 [Candidatus Cloacimonadota bacterium]MDD2682849.1 CRISPR-associated protein Cas5 [Candidatus Cloacimonadota bacterium]MDD3097809.1 CRISPR-associated protein Cas5 [Candidatus Cloacimonadota bacterium]